MLPYAQGGLDSLCGIYSIVNAERVINNSPSEQSLALFNEIIAYLDKRKMLGPILLEGMYLKNVKFILEKVVGARIPYQRMHFAGWPNPDLKTFWNEMARFLNGNSRRAVILSLSGAHDHFTVVKSITDKQIQLFDSNTMKYINRGNCTTVVPTSRMRHVLYPAQTYFLGRS